MIRQLRVLVIMAALGALALAILATPVVQVSAFGLNFSRGNPDAPLGLTLGLDLQGGTHLVYRGIARDGGAPTPEDMEGVRQIIERRVNQFGLSEPTVQLLGEDRILVQLPGMRGASVTVSFAEDTVGPEQLRNVFHGPEIGRTDAVVVLNDDGSMTVHLDALETEAEADRIRAILEQTFPVTLIFVYEPDVDEADPAEADGDPAPEEENGDPAGEETEGQPAGVPDIEEVRAVLAAAGFPDADIELDEQAGLSIFNIDVLGLGDDEVRQSIVADLRHLGNVWVEVSGGYINQWAVGGGIQEAKRLIGSTAQLEFRERSCAPLFAPDDQTPWPPDGLTTEQWAFERCQSPQYYTETAVDLSGDDLADAFPDVRPDIGRPVVSLVFNERGAEQFFRITDRIARTGDLLAIYLDGEELVAPRVDPQVGGIAGGRAIIEGPDFTPERVRTIAIQLRSGALPLGLELVQERNVDATLGAESLQASIIAGAVGLGLLLVFMIAYYKVPGVVAAFALLLYGALLLATFKGLPVTLTLSGLAAVILSLGIAVDANILIAERTKEELRSGRTLLAAINEGFNRAWPSIRDGNVSTIIITVVLFWFGDRLGTSIIQGFALTLAIGVLLSMFTAFFASRIMLRALAYTAISRRLSMFVPVGDAQAGRQPAGGR